VIRRFLQTLASRARYRGLSVDWRANLHIQGEFAYGRGVALAEGCNLIVPAGARLRLGDGSSVGRYAELGPGGAIEIGDRTSVQDRCILVGDVVLGRYCLLSLNVLMTSGVHYFDRWPHLLIRDQDRRVGADAALAAVHSRRITVEDDCWLGMNSVINPGVQVGRGCVVGANAVVTKDLPPYSVAVGAPARIARQRLDFQPPARIDWREPQHDPYFYAGFRLAEDERRGASEGHGALGRFSLWLAPGGELRMRARSASGAPIRVECAGETQTVGSEWTESRYPAPKDGGPARFVASAAGLVVAEAWRA
jgi:acetyltransferase-like isoleucine patch superfamily enzyme